MRGVEFELTFKTDVLKHLDLPVEIRKPNMVLVKRALATEKVDLEPGTYYVGIKMPAGQESWSEVKVEDGLGYKKIKLGPEPEEIVSIQSGDAARTPASESQELQEYFAPTYVTPAVEELTYLALIVAAVAGALIGGAVTYWVTEGNSKLATGIALVIGGGVSVLLLSKVLRPGYTALQQRMREARLGQFKGNVLTGECRIDDDLSSIKQNVRATSDLIEIGFEGRNQNQIIQLLQSGEPAVNVVIPAWQERGCLVVLKKQLDARYSMEVHLKHTEAELLLRYWEQGRWQLAANAIGSTAVSAERLLFQKTQHPISAAIGAYVLLRLGALDRLHNWSENLMNWFQWLPDGAAIRGEHLARMGEHQLALQAFCVLRERGLPYFSDGLSYAVDRLRLYQSLGQKQFEPKDLENCVTTLKHLEPFSYFTDFSKPLTTFTGLDPNKPDSKPVTGKLTSFNGVDVSTLEHHS
ncbi:MAG TPA: hypothetical protein VFT44_13110 [Pyrinomonadaceae bacterium]|nr:hypothetical protein [Pyrinomonadaceae bacterium]